ncbi:hypothetical protein, partial [Parasphingorhabdus sp.]|uniref:hypothetical protein n=1 Tax=Parasphingorhabdus sp. TaxID=2709688 RepID=UPI003C7944F6
VGGVAQTAETDSDTFKVDRKIMLTVSEVGASSTFVFPNRQDAVTAFTVTNTSNAVLDFGLSAAQLTGGTAEHGGTDNFDITGLQIFIDSNGNGFYDVGTDIATFIDELPADTSATVFIVGDIPISQVDNDVAGVILTATAKESGIVGTEGALVTQDTGANTAGVETVFADNAGATDSAQDGMHSSGDDYTIFAVELSVNKTSTVISDPISGVTNPKAIPGATVEYCIAVTNNDTSISAESVTVSDTIPANLSYDSGFGVVTRGTVTGLVCNADGTGTGSESSGAISGNLGSISAGSTKTLVFRVAID